MFATVAHVKLPGPYTPRWHFLGITYNERTSPQTYQISIVTSCFEVRYLIYYQFTSKLVVYHALNLQVPYHYANLVCLWRGVVVIQACPKNAIYRGLN